MIGTKRTKLFFFLYRHICVVLSSAVHIGECQISKNKIAHQKSVRLFLMQSNRKKQMFDMQTNQKDLF
jgi:hypothetical protein